jgi:hypothetical protein
MEPHTEPEKLGLRLIFLDFDGVLNSYRTVWGAPQGKNGWDENHLDPVSIGLVRKLCELTDAKIVISSTWRDHYSNDELKEILAKKGWPDAPIIGRTRSTLSYRFRGSEVGEWMEDFVHRDGNKVESWVILDDNHWFFTEKTSQGSFFSEQPLVKTDELEGMSIANFYSALLHLDPDHPKLKDLEILLGYRPQ